MATRTLVNEPLRVDPSLVGAALASPTRRAVAFVADLVLLLVPTLATAFLAAALALHASDPRAFNAFRTLFSGRGADVRTENAAVCDLVPLLVRTEARGLPAAVVAAVEEGNLPRACEAFKGHDIQITIRFLEESQGPPPGGKFVELQVQKLIPPSIRALVLLGVPALYFVAFTRARRGATIGKRLCGIRVARLDGERLSWLESLERFIGYLHIPATMFIGLVDLWRDPNRRMAHDRTVHTAVFRVRRHQPFPPLRPGAGRAAEDMAGRADSAR